jgi:hypothetical protein
MRWRRAVIEDVPQVASAVRAVHLGAGHTVSSVDGGFDGPIDGIVETGPSCAALKFQPRFKQGLSASGAGKRPGAFFMQQCATSGCFGAVPTHHLILLWRQELAPFGLGVRDWIRLAIHVSDPWLGLGRRLHRPSPAGHRCQGSMLRCCVAGVCCYPWSVGMARSCCQERRGAATIRARLLRRCAPRNDMCGGRLVPLVGGATLVERGRFALRGPGSRSVFHRTLVLP